MPHYPPVLQDQTDLGLFLSPDAHVITLRYDSCFEWNLRTVTTATLFLPTLHSPSTSQPPYCFCRKKAAFRGSGKRAWVLSLEPMWILFFVLHLSNNFIKWCLHTRVTEGIHHLLYSKLLYILWTYTLRQNLHFVEVSEGTVKNFHCIKTSFLFRRPGI